MSKSSSWQRTIWVKALGCGVLLSCTSSDQALRTEADRWGMQKTSYPPSISLKILDKLTKDHKLWQEDIAEVRLCLEAQKFEQQKNLTNTQKSLAQCATTDFAALRLYALRQWVQNLEKSVGKKLGDQELLDRLKAGGLIALLDQKDPLTSLERGSKSPSAGCEKPFKPNEPVMAELREARCAHDFQRSVVLSEKLVQAMRYKKLPMPEHLKQVKEWLSDARSLGNRQEIAKAYGYMWGIYQGTNPLPDSQVKNAVESGLWSARYEALLGRFETAITALRWSQDLIAARGEVIKEADRMELIAEADHIYANRILVEKKDWITAQRVMEESLKRVGLTSEWRHHFLWYHGFYAYLNGNPKVARESLAQLVEEEVEGPAKARALFWLARLSSQLEEKDESRGYLAQLQEEFPFDYYSLLAPKLAGMPLGETGIEFRFQKPRLLGSPLGILKKKPHLARYRRAMELLIAARAKTFARLVGESFYPQIIHSPVKNQADIEGHEYAAKLFYLAGDPYRSLQLIRKIYDQVDQEKRRQGEFVSLLYPTPYLQTFSSVAKAANIPVWTLLGVARQESLFNPEAKSPADAHGLMQLIMPTAQRFANGEVGPEHLYQPKVNVSIAARYLSFLFQQFSHNPAAIFGAYNAGEEVVGYWQKRRYHEDPATLIELIPFQETRRYVQRVWSNEWIYKQLLSS